MPPRSQRSRTRSGERHTAAADAAQVPAARPPTNDQ